jgi:hypothetical protein
MGKVVILSFDYIKQKNQIIFTYSDWW